MLPLLPTFSTEKLDRLPVLLIETLLLAGPFALTIREPLTAVLAFTLPPVALSVSKLEVIVPEADIPPAVAVIVVVSVAEPTAPFMVTDAALICILLPTLDIELNAPAPPTF